MGALAETVFFEQTGGKIQLGGKQTDVTIVQTDFSEIAENGSADFNVVCKLDLSPFKADMDKFPYSLFKKYIPDSLYVSSTLRRLTNRHKDALSDSEVIKKFSWNHITI